MDKNLFRKRYLEFWSSYSGIIPTEQLRQNGDKCLKILESKGITYEEFDRQCIVIEQENKELPFNYNLAAQVIDLCTDERQEKELNKANYGKKPVKLPRNGKEIDFFESPRLQDAINVLNKTSPGFIQTLKRINAKRKHTYEIKECHACHNSGWCEVDRITKEGVSYKAVAFCRCVHGERLKSANRDVHGIHTATKEECILASMGKLEPVNF